MTDFRNTLLNDPVLRPLLLKFLQGLPERLRQLEAAFQSGNLEEVREVAHRLSGAAGSYGIPELREIAVELENDAQLKGLRVKELIQRLAEEIQRVSTDI